MSVRLAAIVVALGLSAPVYAAAPSSQALAFFNARLALREGRTTEVLKWWLLRNSLVDQGEAAVNTGDFRSLVWAALGAEGLCQDGFAKDERGAGLWPLALHNWVLTWVAKGGAVETSPPFDLFEAGLQQRAVSLHDVLSSEELRSVDFFRTACWAPPALLLEQGDTPWGDLSDRLVSGPLLKRLLLRSLQTLARGKVQNVSVVEARLFDLDVALAQLHDARAKQAGLAAQQLARGSGASERGAARAEQLASATSWSLSEPQAEFLRGALRWPAASWLALNRERRLSLFSQARRFADSNTEALMFDVIDALIERKAGAELESWLAWLDASGPSELASARRRKVVEGQRGKRLLELEPGSGFHERATVALHRGLAFLETGAMREALVSFAYAMASAESSREGPATLALARRWVSYVLSRYQTNDEVIMTLRSLVPPQEYNAVVEELVWRAALNTDLNSFDHLVAGSRRGSAFDAKVAKLRVLAKGDAGALATELGREVSDEPFGTLRFIRQLVERLEGEEAEVRAANVPLLKLLAKVLGVVTGSAATPQSHARTAEALLQRIEAMLDALRALDVSVAGKARELSVRHESFAGSIRLAPSDPLPWPFVMPSPEAPSAFVPLVLTPVEWRDESGQLVFGWRLSE